MVRLDEAAISHVRRELEGRSGAWFVLHTRIPGGDATKVTHLETLAASVAASHDIGYFPAGPLYYASNPSDVREEVDHSRLAFVLDEPGHKVEAYMTFLRSGVDVRTATIFRHGVDGLGDHDLLLADAEALIVDVAGLSAGFGQVTSYEGTVRWMLEVAVPDGGTAYLRAQDEVDGGLIPRERCRTTFEPCEGGVPVPRDDAAWAECLYRAGFDIAHRFGVSEPQLIPRPDVRPSFAEVLTGRVHGDRL